MNKLFGFFKQKIVQANVQNKKDIETIVNAISGDDSGYKSDIILSHLQKIKNNYMTWSILIANQASTGLYYSQLHNHSICLKKAPSDLQSQKIIQKNQITQKQIQKTHQQLIEISHLNQNWVQNVSQNMENIKKLRLKRNEQKKLLKKAQQLQSQNQSKKLSKEPQKLSDNNPSQQQAQIDTKSSPIIISSISDPIICFTQQKTNSEIIISSDR